MITEKPYGTLPDGREVIKYTLSNQSGMEAEILNFGGIIVSLTVPDRSGTMSDVMLGFDNLDGYLQKANFSSIVGRHGNRIEGAKFNLNGVEYQLSKNQGENQLHGGVNGFDKKLWDTRVVSQHDSESLELSCYSPDGEEGFPGNLETRVIYSLTNENALKIEYFAASDKDTVVNLTHHAYFNLAGYSSGNVLSHQLKINADFYTPVNPECIPTGEILSVKNTPFDFTQPRAIGDGLINYAENEQIKNGNGYDHNFVLNVSGRVPEEVVEVYESSSGRVMKVLTTSPGIQFYTGNHLGGVGIGKGSKAMEKWQGLCLETQYFPNSMKYSHFPSPVLKAGHTFHHTTIYQFGIR